MNNTSYYQRNREIILNRAKDYYKNDKERLREQVRDTYRNLSEEDKRKRENRGKLDIKEKKQKLKEYQKNYQKGC